MPDKMDKKKLIYGAEDEKAAQGHINIQKVNWEAVLQAVQRDLGFQPDLTEAKAKAKEAETKCKADIAKVYGKVGPTEAKPPRLIFRAKKPGTLGIGEVEIDGVIAANYEEAKRHERMRRAAATLAKMPGSEAAIAEIVADPCMAAIFLAFTQKEHNSEAFEFLQACHANSKKDAKKNQEIYETFCAAANDKVDTSKLKVDAKGRPLADAGAQKDINLPADIAAKLKEKADKKDWAHMDFTAAQKDVRNLLFKDVLPRIKAKAVDALALTPSKLPAGGKLFDEALDKKAVKPSL